MHVIRKFKLVIILSGSRLFSLIL